MNTKQRIELTDTFQSAMLKLVEGNPGALTAVMKLAKAAPQVDPDSAFGMLSPLFALDAQGIYGPRIWMLFKDVCQQDATRVLGLLRAVQLGLLRESVLNHAIDTYGSMPLATVDSYVAQVKKQLPAFAAA